MGRKKANRVKSTHWVLLGAVGLAATAGVVYWQASSRETRPSAPAPLQLAVTAPPAAATTAPPVEAPKEPEAVMPAKKPAPPAVKTPAPKSPSKTAASGPPKTTAPEAAPRIVHRDPPAPAPAMAERSASAAPRSATPVATFKILHDHRRGNFETDDPKAICAGELTVFEHELRFEPRDGADRFVASWADVKDVGGNRFFGSGKGGFHVSVNVDGKYKNFNLAPESKEKAEAKVILDLLESYTRRTERTK
ncbi:MAG TPA: hypothetical protein VFZ31_09420 [Vicinamibacterales bacterium]